MLPAEMHSVFVVVVVVVVMVITFPHHLFHRDGMKLDL